MSTTTANSRAVRRNQRPVPKAAIVVPENDPTIDEVNPIAEEEPATPAAPSEDPEVVVEEPEVDDQHEDMEDDDASGVFNLDDLRSGSMGLDLSDVVDFEDSLPEKEVKIVPESSNVKTVDVVSASPKSESTPARPIARRRTAGAPAVEQAESKVSSTGRPVRRVIERKQETLYETLMKRLNSEAPDCVLRDLIPDLQAFKKLSSTESSELISKLSTLVGDTDLEVKEDEDVKYVTIPACDFILVSDPSNDDQGNLVDPGTLYARSELASEVLYDGSDDFHVASYTFLKNFNVDCDIKAVCEEYLRLVRYSMVI